MWVDLAAGLCVLIFAALGYSRGLFSQAWSVGALIGSYFASDPAFRFVQTRVGLGVEESLLGEWILKLVVGLAIYILLLMVGYGLEKLLVERFQLVSAGNKFLGGVLGLMKGSAGVLVALWVLLFFVAGSGEAEAGDASVQLHEQLESSRLAAAASPYNPCNLLLLARLRPYLPQEATGSARAPVAAPKAVAKNETFQAVLKDSSLMTAYKERRFVEIIRNPTFHRFVADTQLLAALEKSK